MAEVVRAVEAGAAPPVDAARFWALVRKGAPDECWNWIGSTSQGFGVFAVDKRRKQLAQRIAFSLTYGAIHCGQVVKPTCCNKLCVNPRHLAIVKRERSAKYFCRVARPDPSTVADAGALVRGALIQRLDDAFAARLGVLLGRTHHDENVRLRAFDLYSEILAALFPTEFLEDADIKAAVEAAEKDRAARRLKPDLPPAPVAVGLGIGPNTPCAGLIPESGVLERVGASRLVEFARMFAKKEPEPKPEPAPTEARGVA